MTGATGFTAKGGFFGASAHGVPLARAADGPAAATVVVDREPVASVAGSVPASPVEDRIHLVVDDGEDQQVRRSGWLRTSVRVAGNLVMLAMVAAFTLVAVLPATGARAMIVLSGSMEPLLSAGDAAIISDVPADELAVGDVITFQGIGEDKRLTTHRIIDLVELERGLHFQTQGDANSSPDVDLAPAGGVVGRYDGRIPYGGRVLLLLSRPEAKIVLVAVPALLILMGELRTLAAAAADRRRVRTGTATRPVAVTVAMLFLAATVGVAATMATMAVITDADHAGNNTFSTGTFG